MRQHRYGAIGRTLPAVHLLRDMFRAKQHAKINADGLDADQYACHHQRHYHQGFEPALAPAKLIDAYRHHDEAQKRRDQ